MKNFSRRAFIRRTLLGAGGTVITSAVGGTLTGCNADDIAAMKPADFNHGVASGDPLSDSVIIWTRVTPENLENQRIYVEWKIATDEQFNNVVVADSGIAEQGSDYTLKIDVKSLDAGTQYYYQFNTVTSSSPVGKMKTLPVGDVDRVKFVVVSCSNYPAGYFHGYAEAALLDDVDVSLHLGDYLYEYSRGGYASEDAPALNREVLPEGELFTLEDYRARYAQYRTDPDLQHFHQAFPMIAVWDDHEVANDTWKEGAENHNEDEGDFYERLAAALQAYAEWMPIRPAVDTDASSLYRSFQFGNLVNLMMLDTRIVGRDQQLSIGNYFNTDGSFDADAFNADVTDENRTLLGGVQTNWVLDELESNAVWQVLGQQVLMGRMELPGAVATAQLSIEAYAELAQIAQIAQTNPELLTAEQLALLQQQGALLLLPNLPYNLDAWDGYASERDQILQTASINDANLVVLAGDTHNAWANNLSVDVEDDVNSSAGVEFATSSISSPGLEAFLGLNDPVAIAQTEAGLTQLITGLVYTNLVERGFLSVTFTVEEVRADWHYVSSVKEASYQVIDDRSHSIVVPAGENAII